MSIEEHLNRMKTIQKALLELIEADKSKEKKYNDFIKLLMQMKINSNCDEFKTFLHLIVQVSKHHHQSKDFYFYIEKIFLFFQKDIKKYFSNSEIHTIFKRDFNLMLSLIKSKILINNNYIEIPSKEDLDPIIFRILHDDLIDEFISYVNKHNLSITDETIVRPESIKNKRLRQEYKSFLIEYAAFYGSAKIFKYLIKNSKSEDFGKYKLSWFYAIDSNNYEIIHLLEELKIESPSFQKCFEESIKCHHNDLANYIKNNYLDENNSVDITKCCLKYYNFEFIEKEMINKSQFHFLCKYDYITFVKLLCQNGDIDINERKKII